jgi:sugar phosphate permease
MGHDDPAQGITKEPRPAASSGRPTHVRYLVLAVACSLAVLTYIQRQGFVAGTPYIKASLHLNDEDMGFLAAVWLLAYGAFQVPCGLLGDRFGARLLLTVLVFGWSILLGAVALTADFPLNVPALFLLFPLRFLFGAFQAGGFPVLARVIADWMPSQQRGFAQGMVWTFSRLGGAVAPKLIVILITKVFFGWAIPLVLVAGLGLIWCAGFWTWFRNRPEEMPQVNAEERALIASERSASRAPQIALPWGHFLRSRSVWGLCLLYGFGGFAGNFITSLLPIYLHDHRHLNDDDTATLSGLPLAFGIVSCLLGGTVSDWLIRRTGSRKWGRRLVGCIAMALAGLTTLSVLWTHDVWMMGLAFSAWFFFNDATMGPAWASCADVGERYAGTLSGAMNMTGAFFGAVGMAFAGACFRRGLIDVVFIVFACSYGLAALCWFAVDVTKPLVPRADQT